MKQSSFILSMIIPGEKSLGNDIDICLQPLIKELNELWEDVETYDASGKHIFLMRDALMWIINDFPAYANLSGWSMKKIFACPCCAEFTFSKWLNKGGNIVIWVIGDGFLRDTNFVSKNISLMVPRNYEQHL